MIKEQVLINFINSILKGEEVTDMYLSSEEVIEILALAKGHHLLNLIYKPISSILLDNGDLELLHFVKKEYIKYDYHMKMLFVQFNKICNAFNEAGIKYVVIKGFALAKLYPAYEHRAMSDIDIYVDPKSYQEALNILIEMGMAYTYGVKHDILVMKDKYLVELHKHLFEYRIVSIDEQIEDDILSSRKSCHFKGIEFNVLTHQKHYIYLVLHMITHLQNASFGIKQLIDLVLITGQFDVNYDYYVKYFKVLGFEKVYINILMVCNILFDMPLPEKYVKEIPPNMDTLNEFVKLVINNGAHGFALENSVQTSMQREFFDTRRKRNKHSKLLNTLMFFFPGSERINDQYKYAKKWKVLLPAAWLHRIVRYIFRRDLDHRTKLFFLYANKQDILSRDKLLESIGL